MARTNDIQKTNTFQRYLEEIGSGAKKSAGFAPEVNLREKCNMYASVKNVNQAAHSGFKTEEMSPKVQNKGNSGPTKSPYVLKSNLSSCLCSTKDRNSSKDSVIKCTFPIIYREVVMCLGNFTQITHVQ